MNSEGIKRGDNPVWKFQRQGGGGGGGGGVVKIWKSSVAWYGCFLEVPNVVVWKFL